MHRTPPCLVFLLALFLALPAAGASPPALVLHNGKIFTGDPAQPQAQALAIRDGRIVAAGDDADVLTLAAPGTERIDLRSHRVVPGINDAHEHLGWLAPPGLRLELSEPEPGGEELEAALSAQPTDGEDWIRGTVGSRIFLDRSWNRARLDALHPTRPVVLRVLTGHGLLVNSVAMRLLQVDPSVAVPGGWYGRDDDGGFDGRLYEYAGWKAMLHYPRPGDDAEIERLRRYADTAAKTGITSVQNMASLPLAQFVDLWTRSGAPQRLRAVRWPEMTDEAGLPAADLSGPLPGTRIVVSGTKWILDGTPFDRSTPLREPYPDGSNGRLNFDADQLRAKLEEALARDDQLLLHIGGDTAAQAAMDAMLAIAPAERWRDRRVRFEHGDGLTPDLLRRAAGLGIVVVQNPSHFMLPEAHPFTAMVRERGFSPLSDLVAAGIPLAIGSDGPSNPWLNLMFATVPASRPDQALSREQALRAYTQGSAFAEFAEGEKGRLAPGYLADLAVLSQDVLDEAAVPAQDLPKTRSLLTVIGGDVVWRDPSL